MIRTLLRTLACCACALAGLLAWSQTAAPAPAPGYAIRTDRSGAQINWLTGNLEAVGVGYVRDRSAMSVRQARTTAMTIMNREARRVLYTLRVDAHAILGDLAKDAQALRALDSLLAHLTVIDEKTSAGVVAMVGVLPLYGEQGVTYFGAKGLSTAKAVEVKPAELTLLPQIPRGHTPQRFDGPYTGVIINADAMVLTPCLFPRVLRYDGKELWGAALPQPMTPVAVVNGPVRYAANLEAAIAGKLAGDRPLILEAVGVGQGCYPAVNLDDVFLVLNEHKYQSLLTNLPIIFTLGKTQ
ncbi:MAG TPA: hypothetical protein PLZ36_10390 [Armatimonadota bacterium]|mgnify:CR=1 FL=1|nr:hypothetical protein [Armatimonadota bacterium]HOS44782.1 hypothetical protein [Armatimonadota bacterium]